MPNPATRLNVDQCLLLLRIISVAVMASVVVFLVVILAQDPLSQPGAGYLASLLGIACTPLALAAPFAVPVIIRVPAPAGEAQDAAHRPLSIVLTRQIMTLAAIEGAAMFNIVALTIEHHWWSLIPTGILLMAMIAAWPMRTRIEQFLETVRMEDEIRERRFDARA